MTKNTAIQRQRTSGRLNRSLDLAILEAAFIVLAEHGYDAMSMDEIAARAGVGAGAAGWPPHTPSSGRTAPAPPWL